MMYTLRNRKTGRKSARRRFTEARRTSQTAVYPHLDERVNRLSQHRGRARKRRGSELRGRDSQIAGQGSVDNTGGRTDQGHAPESKLRSFFKTRLALDGWWNRLQVVFD